MSITLLCLVKGNTTAKAFSVKIGRDETISELKKTIKAEKAPEFDSFPANKLKLWKVEIPDEQEDALLNLSLQENALLPTREIGEYWTKPPKKHIHVIVETPEMFEQFRRRTLPVTSVPEENDSLKRRKIEEGNPNYLKVIIFGLSFTYSIS